ncbi:hypothetical protein DFR26_1419 [Paraperlucidibaca baekdonensis]|uniref:Fe-S protein YdhL (DUF1289 family) n=1 Tax=Paraperlucidibaca baekdonensis TaxID=748120 RepID=A0A3E0H4T4_9GAMM|nr:DUF1289 domain-containing protein [Paraperlucidibaca baekdonensis]REH37640.1 hypothetical protein DFR26_1419 [Paraperlucidibaca baekdonensis]
MPSPAKSLSPCVGLCKLNADDVCLGCQRSMAEIRSWGLLTLSQQRKILTRIYTQRRAERQTSAVAQRSTAHHPD